MLFRSIRALRIDPSQRPPMNMRPLMQAAGIDAVLTEQIDALIAIKADVAETGRVQRQSAIERLIEEELDRAAQIPERDTGDIFREEAEALFLQLVEEQ